MKKNINNFESCIKYILFTKYEILVYHNLYPSSLTIDVKEMEDQGKGFKGQMSTPQLGLLLEQYINEPGILGMNRKILISAFLLKKKVNIFTPDKNLDCNLELRKKAIIYFLNDKSAETVKFLGSLASTNPQKATEALLKDPEVREMFEKYELPSNN